MLTYRQLEDAGEAIVRIMAEIEQALINDMAQRIGRLGEVTATSSYQAFRHEIVSDVRKRITEELARAFVISERRLVELFDEAATRALKFDNRMFKAAGLTPTPLAENNYLQQIIRAGLVKTLDSYQNLTMTTANTTRMQFERALDLAHQLIASGGASYEQAIRAGIRSLAVNGIASITYPTGHTDYLDVAFRRATLTGVNQLAAEVQLSNLSQMGIDLVETTAHPGARPDHQGWQGRIFSLSGTHNKYTDFRSQTGYGTGPGLCGWNCRHSFFPFFEGLSEPGYSAEKLREYNNKTVMLNGQEMSLYDATQLQRYHERQIRRWKREASAYDAAGLDSSAAWAKVHEWQAVQRDFIRQTGLSRDYFRESGGTQNLHTPSKDDIIRLQLKDIGVTGDINIPPRQIDIDTLGFDSHHVNVERGRNITEAEAKSFIQNAAISTTKWNGERENYYSYNGVTYVNVPNHEIATAYKPENYYGYIQDLMEVLRKNGL